MSPEQIAAGQQLFVAACSTCHGVDAEGMPMLGKNLHHNQLVTDLSEDEMVAFLEEGRPASHPDNERGIDMPPRGGNPAITDQDLRLIAVFLRSLQ